MTKLRWIPVSLLAAVLILSVACGGDDDDNGGASGAANTPTATAAASSGATGSATATAQPQGSTGATGSSGAITGFENVKSGHFNMTLKMNFDTPDGATGSDADSAAMLAALLGNIQVQGSYVAPDRVQTKTTLFGQTLETIQIGSETWINDGSGWKAGDASDGLGSAIPFDPSSPDSLFDIIPQDKLDKADKSQESVNGYDTTKYHFDKDALAELAQSSGAENPMGDLSEVDKLDLNVWITKDGVPVKMAMDVAGESEGSNVSISMNFDVTDLNDSSIKIDKPI
jgi:hypothetical protein